ncbi:hypothetical protein [Streptomyces sp. NPDC050264]
MNPAARLTEHHEHHTAEGDQTGRHRERPLLTGETREQRGEEPERGAG